MAALGEDVSKPMRVTTSSGLKRLEAIQNTKKKSMYG
jgi:hypothetical protein